MSKLLRALDVAGCIVTTDAMGCQKKIARGIIESDADHVLALKGSSPPSDAELFGRAVRGHWAVENSCHWILDVVMREDDSRTRNGHGAENLATLRRMATNALSREKTKKRGIKGKQLNASWDHGYLLKLLDF